jgi:hypothetical protein
VHNIDDFDIVMDDIRPFWAIEPKVLRNMAAYMSEEKSKKDGVAGIHIRDKKVVKLTNQSWRSETLKTLIEKFVDRLPDMDIAMNRLDQPRVVVPWEDMQAHLQKEIDTRRMPPDAIDSFSTKMDNLLNLTYGTDDGHREDPAWFLAPGKQYMEIASLACPPESPARDHNMSIATADTHYKEKQAGIITSFNLSSDLCTVGPAIQDKHGFLFSSSSVVASKKLVPIFGECKVNVNSDILFPANMYWKHDDRYDYSPKYDLEWDDKKSLMVWRGVTSGGVQIKENWTRLHRQRLVMLSNGTLLGNDSTATILTQAPPPNTSSYVPHHSFHPSEFANKYTDIGFTEAWGCVPGDCPFYKDPVQVWTYKPPVTLSEQFKNKFLVDVDGHSFSGRWRAFLESRSLGIKATIFREWHDSRLFAWRHFVPMDNRFDDFYTLLTYFIGVGNPPAPTNPLSPTMAAALTENEDPYIRAHDFEASRLARQGREWASKVLRRDDIEIYMYRLLLEYGRVVDDNRDRIGYSGDGRELDKWDSKNPVTEMHG